MSIALKEAEKAMTKKHGGPFGAVIVCNGKIVAKAHNTVLKETNSCAHAEINAIKKAQKKLKRINLSDCVIYSSVEPCPMCLSAIHWAKIKKIVYGATIKDAKACGFNEINLSDREFIEKANLNISLEQTMSKEAKELLKKYKQQGLETY